MALISKKKTAYKISDGLRKYLNQYSRTISLPLEYNDLTRYSDTIPLYDGQGKDTHWETVFYPQGDMQAIYQSLKKVYAIMKAHGDLAVMDHLFVDRVDLCVYGNTQPFRIRIVNRINDNFDYFYIKNADASRIYGLELEHLLSPNKLSFLVNLDTLLEEHIVGIPGDMFINKYLRDDKLNPIRLSKEFVKFNERCFVRLLGDMHSSNFVVDITPDFEEVDYRLRAIDFDQQSYESRRAVYLPMYFKQNNPIIEFGMKYMTPETVRQYQQEERTLISRRIKIDRKRIDNLLDQMELDTLAPSTHIANLGKELAKFYEHEPFKNCTSMGSLVRMSLEMLRLKPRLYHDQF